MRVTLLLIAATLLLGPFFETTGLIREESKTLLTLHISISCTPRPYCHVFFPKNNKVHAIK